MPRMDSPEDYVAEVLSHLAPLPAVELPLSKAHGAVLAADVQALLPVPPWTNSAMDGYAVRSAETVGASPSSPRSLPVSGDLPAGQAPGPLAPGSAIRIMTGAALPKGADAVVRVEDTDQSPGPHPLPTAVALHKEVQPGENVRQAGENVTAGEPVLSAGTVLSATALSSLVSTGHASVPVIPRPRVAVISTGSELVPAGQTLKPGMIPDSNSVLLSGLIQEAGGVVGPVLHAGDSAEELSATLRKAATQADLVVTSGGVSAGAYDPLTMLAAATSPADGAGGVGTGTGTDISTNIELSFTKVAMQPGKPQGRGVIHAADGRDVPILMLPGNPVGVLVSFTLIVAPALARLGGWPPINTPPLTARAAVGWKAAGARRQHIPVRFVTAPSQEHATDSTVAPWVEPTHRLGSGSHLVASLSQAQALAVVPAGVEEVRPGDGLTLIAVSSPARPAYSL